MRAPLLTWARPCDASDDGRRGTKARSTDATAASTTPTQSKLASSVRSRARTENRAAYRPSTDTIGWAISTPTIAPVTHTTRLSASNVFLSAALLAPRAARIASSDSRRTDRARIRFATFEQAITNTSADAANSTRSTVRACAVI